MESQFDYRSMSLSTPSLRFGFRTAFLSRKFVSQSRDQSLEEVHSADRPVQILDIVQVLLADETMHKSLPVFSAEADFLWMCRAEHEAIMIRMDFKKI